MRDPSTITRAARRSAAGRGLRARRPRVETPEAPAPEWQTDHWKHRVEAEARHSLKREIREVGTPH
jgi:hypothetical protein